jgi:uncharacterized repeat protein (TIGR03837 family)
MADIFCRIVDNFGDIGVCWRLARRLAHGHGWRVRLWVDDLRTFARLAPEAAHIVGKGCIEGIGVVHWTTPAAPLSLAESPAGLLHPGDVVIEAFACDPPADFVRRIGHHQVWLNLEYLSAEAWIESCHALPSPQPAGVSKYFFFPGFTPSTGGLLREPGLLQRRDAFQADMQARLEFLAQLGVPPQDRQRVAAKEADVLTLFCYRDAPVSLLHQALAHRERPSLLLATDGTAPWLAAGAQGSTRVVRLPFLPPDDFDRLLWSADLNFVRGEDSFVRAQWAARPMVWQVYPQEEAAHLDKLDAWLDRYTRDEGIASMHRSWNGEGSAGQLGGTLHSLLAPAALGRWKTGARQWSDHLATQEELADQLVDFCLRRLK